MGWLPGPSQAWTTYTPTYSGGTLGDGTVDGAYRIEGKTMFIRLQLTSGSTTNIATANQMSFTLPSGTARNAAPDQVLAAAQDGSIFLGTGAVTCHAAIQRNTNTVKAKTSTAMSGAGWAFYISGAIELA